MVSPSAVAEIGKRLGAAREKLGRSLDDLAGATRINRQFLEQIEKGKQPAVPDIYFRAFVKTVAAELGENTEELLMLLEEATPPPPPLPAESDEPPAPARTQRADTGAAAVAAPAQQRGGSEAVRRQAKILVGLAFLVVAGLVMSVYWLRNERSEKGVQEISFADVVKEQSAKLQPPDSAFVAAPDTGRPDAPAKVPARQMSPAPGDSLLLQAVTSESVWVHIAIDGGGPSEYTLPPNFQIAWKARNQFSISLGNPGGVSFAMNGKQLGRLAEGKKPVRNVTLTRATLDAR